VGNFEIERPVPEKQKTHSYEEWVFSDISLKCKVRV
jgi:hypothetical protein